jgi:glycine dehydrogenase
MQPASGATGEYAGLNAIRMYHKSRGESNRNVCLIPTSAHGTNPATATLVGMKVVPIPNNAQGFIEMPVLKQLCEKYSKDLACLMITYPSTYGVFDDNIRAVCDMVHLHGGQIYMDGANMNAQLGLTSPGYIGADCGHLNLHKTFAIPHGGGGPGIGACGYKKHLEPFMPGHCIDPVDGRTTNAVAGAAYGNAGVIPISYSYIKMNGKKGLY